MTYIVIAENPLVDQYLPGINPLDYSTTFLPFSLLLAISRLPCTQMEPAPLRIGPRPVYPASL